MRIACIGNMNNILSPAAQYLSDMGHQVDLILLYEYDHFAPAADFTDAKKIKYNIVKLGMQFGNVMTVSKSEIRAVLSGFDYYIGTDYAPALLARIGIRIDMFAWAGTDLFDWPFYKSSFVIPQLWEVDLMRTASFQKKGIQNARILPMSLNNPFILNALKKLKYKNSLIEPLPFMYYPEAIENCAKENVYTKAMESERKEGKLILVQQSRQWWKTAPSNISKGNDIFLKGMKLFSEKNPQRTWKAYLFEYGADVEHSKQLILELGLQNSVEWLPLMERKDLLAVLGHADIGVGQFGSESWYLYCSNAEILMAGAAYLGYRDDEFCAAHDCELYPMLNANSPEAIANVLASANLDKVKNTGRDWLLKYNEARFFENIQNDLVLSKMRNIGLGVWTKWELYANALKYACIEFLNKLILSLRMPFLRTSLLAWKKN